MSKGIFSRLISNQLFPQLTWLRFFGFEFWMAIRMLLSRKKVGFISWSGFISIIGVSVGCFALIVSIAVLNGFEQEVRNKIIGFEAEIRLTPLKKELRLEGGVSSLALCFYIAQKGKINLMEFH